MSLKSKKCGKSLVVEGCRIMRVLKLLSKAIVLISLGSAAFGQSCEDVEYEESCWLRKEAASSKIMIFVHGIDGSASETWSSTADNNGPTWPEIVVEDNLFSDADVLVVNYLSTKWRESPSIDSLSSDFFATEILERGILDVHQNGVARYQDILFVAHSMGGLIVRNIINGHKGLAERTPAIFTFATPTGGSRLANWLSSLSSSASLEDMAQLFKIRYQVNESGDIVAVESSFLNDLRDEWRRKGHMEAITSFCAFEIDPTVGWGPLRSIVVEKRDVEFLCNRVRGLPGDHNSIVTPDDPWSAHKLLASWYLEIYPDRSFASTVEENGDVVLIKCDTDFYEFEEYVGMQGFLDELEEDMGLRWRFSTSLPKDWRDDYRIRIWARPDAIPSMLVMHYSCFQEGGNNRASLYERATDILRFLQSLESTRICIVFFSRAFNEFPGEIVTTSGDAGYRFYDGDDGREFSNETLERLRASYFPHGCQRIFSVPSSKKTSQGIDKFEKEFRLQTRRAAQQSC
ncbi:hypothetical protein [Phaeobacter sp. J2-8]|uniref:esterase/lipase family protein n=1 Tax=Phaeobacter sp. J2-8 TaxID=2931394 RepID=UPI001FD06A40|nr:hypothetical protein [Phaeobacter sp. J2-8]MCJ7872939.1 hypothetical protein [Phaeobacter sp. J2-8]